MIPTDDMLWWIMIIAAIAAAGLSVITTMLDRRGIRPFSRQARFLMHIASYVLMTVSIAIFVLRGLLGPD